MPSEPIPLPPKLILISTKAYFSPSRTISYLEALLDPQNSILPLSNPKLLFALIPDFLSIYPCTTILNQHSGSQPWPLILGSQDCFWEPTYGAFTGEIVPSALAELGVRIVELGHAERRRMLAETDETTAKKAAAVAACGMISLVCVGEIEKPTLNGPLSMAVGTAMRQLTPQISAVLSAVAKDAAVVFAYEPVWAIGAAEPASVAYVGPVVQGIREVVKGFEKNGRTGQTRVVYGGSAGPGLWSGKSNGGDGLGKWVDGMFLGRFAHEVQGVTRVVEEVLESMQDGGQD